MSIDTTSSCAASREIEPEWNQYRSLESIQSAERRALRTVCQVQKETTGESMNEMPFFCLEQFTQRSVDVHLRGEKFDSFLSNSDE